MNPAIETSLGVVAWLVTLLRLPSILRSRAWRSDRIAFRIWIATFFFSVTMTFLITPLRDLIDRYSWLNFARLLTYLSVSQTLYLVSSSFMITFPTQINTRQLRYLKPSLVFTSSLLVLIYVFFVSRTPEWVEEALIPATAAEVAFKSVIFSYATTMCAIMALACYRYVHQEKVAVTRYRITTIILTATSGAVYFLTKFILPLGYFWSPLGSAWIHTLSKILMVVTAMLWGGSFLHNTVYAYAVEFLRGVSYWPIYRDLSDLADRLERLCPPISVDVKRPSVTNFSRNYEYHLYRSAIRILDSKTMLVDFLNGEMQPDWWTPAVVREARQVHRILESINTSGEFWDLIRSFRIASRQLLRYTISGKQEAVS